MENKRTKLISVLLIVLCLSLCVGATYAYFTDSVTSAGNKIQAGNLKIDLELLDKETGNWNSIKTSQAPIFNYNLWEPGYTDVKLLKVENEGNLAIKWEAKLVTEGTLNELADEIEVYVTTSNDKINFPTDLNAVKGWTKVGTLRTFFANTGINGTLEATKASYFAIALHLPTTVENTNAQGVELQDLALPEFDIQIVATQYTHESDAFDNQYDADATIPCDHPVTETVAGRDATCSTAGLSEGERCVACGEMTVEQQPISTIPHTAGEWLIDVEPTPDAEGSKYAPCTVCGEEAAREAMQYSESIFTWSLNEDRKSYTVTGFKEGEETFNFTIPNTYNGFPVTDIGERAFYGLTIEHVIISDGIETIGNYAFAECLYPNYSCATVEVPVSVTTIGDYAFLNFSKTMSTEVQTRKIEVHSCIFYYNGTVEQWNAITFGESWCQNMGTTCISCLGGDVYLNNKV